MGCVGQCGIYKSRPKFCRDYPQPGDFLPPECTYSFEGGERKGECDPSACQDGNCCNYPREGGEPEATSMDVLAGGEPCKHLVWVIVPDREEKTAENEEDTTGFNDELYETVLTDMFGDIDVR